MKIKKWCARALDKVREFNPIEALIVVAIVTMFASTIAIGLRGLRKRIPDGVYVVECVVYAPSCTTTTYDYNPSTKVPTPRTVRHSESWHLVLRADGDDKAREVSVGASGVERFTVGSEVVVRDGKVQW
jgi:hypothetical protein